MNPLLKLSRETLEKFFDGKEIIVSEDIKKKFSKKQACFVTLTKNKQLRGCIGSLDPRKSLYKDVVDNTINAAFHDPRFLPLKKEELSAVKIEISFLSVPLELNFTDSNDLLNKLNPGKDGIIIKKGFASATYLPQVWEQFPNKKEFLSSLCEKAGLPGNSWKMKEMKIFVYHVQSVKEG